jgi:hypothetical protein
VFFNGDLDGIAKFALRDLDTGIFALFVDTTSTVVGRCLCNPVSIPAEQLRVSQIVA